MPQARRKSSGGGSKSRGKRGIVLLLLGIGIGVGGLYLWQLVSKSIHQRGGLAALVDSVAARPAPAPTAEPARPDKDREPPKTGKPRYEFYTLLQNETVLPDRESTRGEKGGRPTKSEEGATFVLQAGSFTNFDDADNLKARLALAGLIAHIQKVEVDGKPYHRVRLGPYDRIEQLDTADDQLKKLNIRALRQKVRKTL